MARDDIGHLGDTAASDLVMLWAREPQKEVGQHFLDCGDGFWQARGCLVDSTTRRWTLLWGDGEAVRAELPAGQ